MKMRQVLILLTVILNFAGPVYAEDIKYAGVLFSTGNTYYSEGNFEQAIKAYEEVLKLGFESGYLYYNLGNAYFKHGFLGKAVLNYLRAKRLIPKDADLKSNLDYAQSLIKNGGVIPERKWFLNLFFQIAGLFSLDIILLISVVLYFSFSAAGIIAIISRKRSRGLVYIIAITTVFLLVSVSLFSAQFYKIVMQKEAVVIVKSSDCKFEPFNDATTFFNLNEGESVFIIGDKMEWLKIKRLDGKQGWIKKTDIEALDSLV